MGTKITTFDLCKSMIERQTYSSVNDMQLKLDVFFATNRISQEEYTEGTKLLVSQTITE